jgi:hypothetical protein
MTGMRSYIGKQRREQRRRNHVAKDLGTPKYRQRIKRDVKPYEEWTQKDWLDEFTGE